MPHPETGQIHWFNPDPRAVIPIGQFHVSKSMNKFLKTHPYQLSLDSDFTGVMQGCAARKDTWITPEFHQAYNEMHRLGMAHSSEVWEGEELVGGVYGVSIGAAFFAESMFHRRTNTSKLALWHLTQHLAKCGYILLEVQFITPHLKSLGAIEIASEEYLRQLKRAVNIEIGLQYWKFPKSPI